MNHWMNGALVDHAQADADTKTTVRGVSLKLLRLTIVLALATLCWSVAGAQTLGFALSYEGGLEPEVQLRDLDAGSVGLGLRLADGIEGPLEAGVNARFRSSFGPLGTLAVNGRADADVTGAFDLGLNGSGALGATGLDARLDVFNRNPGAFARDRRLRLGQSARFFRVGSARTSSWARPGGSDAR